MSQLLLKRNVTITAIVTERWKEEAQQQLQQQVDRLDKQMQQVEAQGQQAISDIQKQAAQPSSPQVMQQIDNIRLQVNQKQRELLQQKNQLLQQLQQAQTVEMGAEVRQAQIEGFFEVNQGDNLIEKLQVEVVLRDGVVEEIRGQI